MSVMDFFRSTPANVTPPANTPPAGGNGQSANGNPQDNQQSGNTPPNAGNQQAANPLDAYTKMWDTPKDGQAEVAPEFKIDSKILDNVTSSQDFTKGIDPQLVERAMAGDAKSMMEIMQGIGRNAYRASLEHGGLLTDKFVGARESFNEKGFSKKVRGELTTQALADTPNFAHPVVRKQLTDTATQLQKLHPDASPKEIADMAKKHLTDLFEAVNPKKDNNSEEARTNGGKQPTNWDTFFDEPQQ